MRPDPVPLHDALSRFVTSVLCCFVLLFTTFILLLLFCQDGLTPLLAACAVGRVDVIKALLGAKADKEAKDKVRASLASFCKIAGVFIIRWKSEGPCSGGLP